MCRRKQWASWRHPHIEKIAKEVLKVAFRNKWHKTIDAFFFKNAVKWSPIIFYFLLLVGRYWVPRYLSVPSTTATLAYCTNPDDRWGWFFEQLVEWNNGRGNRSTRRKPTPVPLCPPQNPTWKTRFRTPDRSGGKPATNRLKWSPKYWINKQKFTVHIYVCKINKW
jgi:hypothetical protein